MLNQTFANSGVWLNQPNITYQAKFIDWFMCLPAYRSLVAMA